MAYAYLMISTCCAARVYRATQAGRPVCRKCMRTCDTTPEPKSFARAQRLRAK